MADIFISYARTDQSRVELLAKALNDKGWTVFWDRTIPAGRNWRRVIDDALKNARSVIVVWSKRSVKSRWVIEEADWGFEQKKLIPILVDNVRPPLGFRSINAVDLISCEWESTKSAPEFEKLIAELSAILSPPPMEAKKSKRTSNDEILQKNRGQLEADIAGLITIIQNYQIHNSVSDDIPDISGTWSGSSGEMIIVVEGKKIKGDYDYAGFTKAGHIEGNFDGQVIIFKWWWDRSGDNGNGFFFYDRNAQKLKGSWFLKDQEINLPDDFAILTRDMMQFWSFTDFRPTK